MIAYVVRIDTHDMYIEYLHFTEAFYILMADINTQCDYYYQ